MSAWNELVASGLVVRDVALAPFTTYKVGGPARYFADVDDEAGLRRIGDALRISPLDVIVLGRGSNLLVADAGFDGLVIRLGTGFSWVRTGPVVIAGGATPLAKVARACADGGWSGLEFFIGIPGSVGGAVRMNAGCHGVETADRLMTARILDLGYGGTMREATPETLAMSYRHSSLSDRDVVLSASFQTTPAAPEEVESRLREITRWRREHQPGGTLNAGSVFKNPDGDSAGRIIDACGLKGLAVGGARVSAVHANFIEAEGATAGDIHRLIRLVQQRVLASTGIRLEPEIRMIGEF
jgi:UDP-N-acetylmuramate dehydrogenase